MDDELSRLFWKLATATRNQILGILEKKIQDYRQTQGERLVERERRIKDPKDNSRYIDALVKHIVIDIMVSTVEMQWKENQKDHWVTVDLKDFYGGAADSTFFHDKVFPNESSARAELQAILSAARSQPQNRGVFIINTYYRGPYDTILPTTFFHGSAPTKNGQGDGSFHPFTHQREGGSKSWLPPSF
jgi:hypothetical protein